MDSSVKIAKNVNVYMAQNNTSVLVMKVTPEGNMEFPNSSEVDIAIEKVFNENIDEVVGCHIVFKVRFKEPVKVLK